MSQPAAVAEEFAARGMTVLIGVRDPGRGEAEDAVQETWFRYAAAPARPDSVKGSWRP